MESVADRTKRLRDELGLTQKSLGILAGVSKSAVSQWERGICEPERDALLSLQKTKKVNPDWLITGKGGMFIIEMKGLPDQNLAANLLPGPPLRGRVPVISWASAGQWGVIVDNNQPGQAEDFVETSIPIRTHTYALKVQGDSMEPLFPSGSFIVVEPEMDAEHGDYVVVRQSGDEATFKQLIRDGGKVYLKPINPRYPIMELAKDAAICGVVRAMEMRFK